MKKRLTASLFATFAILLPAQQKALATILQVQQETLMTLTDSLSPQQPVPASVKETSLEFPTYPFSDPDPIAKPDNPYYPYFRFDGYSEKAVTKKWNVIEMENEYLKLTILPEIGGKLWGAEEKSTGKHFIYFNHSVKFRDIAMRGAWTSGGIEFNFGIIGHAPTTATPVDYFIRTNEDGSVSCFISALELITRTTWTVEINLPPDKAYFTTQTTWSNTSSLEQPYYQWINAGYKAAGNLEFCFPGQYYIGHGGDVHSFPIDNEGRNISWYEKNNFGKDKSYHVLGEYNDFYGAYWHDDHFGSVHYAPYDEKLGMKIFLWGLSRSGEIWEELLTDTDGQYVELQSGRMFNQPATNSAYTPYKHFSFLPGTTDKWKEYWFPVKETGGISKASPAGTLYAVRNNGMLDVSFSPLQKTDSYLVIRDKERTLYREPLQLKVLETRQKSFPVAENSSLSIEIGEKELVWHESPETKKYNRPNSLPANFDWDGVYGLYVKGEQWMNQKLLLQVEQAFLQCLEKEPFYLPALNKMASLCFRTARYEKALEYAKTALSLDAYDGEANYIYGLINYGLNQTDAKDGFSVAAFSPAYRSAALGQLAKCFLKEKNHEKAIHYASEALESNPRNQDAIMVCLAAFRKSGEQSKAKDYAIELLEEMPLNHAVRFEETLLAGNTGTFTNLVRNELAFETYIEIAEWYSSVDMWDEALTLLGFAEKSPVAGYWIAYIQHLLGNEEESNRQLTNAIDKPADLIFPFRPATLKVLEWAQGVSPSWKTDYYLSLILWHLGDKSKALELLDKYDNVPFAPFYQSRSMLKSGDAKLADLLKAEQIDSSWRVGFALINYYLAASDKVSALQVSERYAKKHPSNYMIGLKYAKALQLNGKYAESIALLKKTHVLPNEGAYEGRAIYRESHLYQAVNQLNKKKYAQAIRSVEESKIWIENLGVGKPYEEEIDNRLEDFITATIYEKQGKTVEAEKFYQKVVDNGNDGRQAISNELLMAVAYNKTGNQAEGNRLASRWINDHPESKSAQWAHAYYSGDKKKVSELLVERYTVENKTPWEQSLDDSSFNLISGILQLIGM